MAKKEKLAKKVFGLLIGTAVVAFGWLGVQGFLDLPFFFNLTPEMKIFWGVIGVAGLGWFAKNIFNVKISTN